MSKKYQDPTRKDWVSGIAVLLVYVIVISAGAVLLIPEYWVGWVALMLVSTILLVIRQNRNYACRCRECGHEFEVSFLANLVAPHGVDKGGGWQLVRCPNCKKRAKATVIKVIKAS
ncbi:MAG: hypothetical protein MUC85_05740 [Anaerolineales bacterium]|jgi:hypothetical protein|nr:hypothetical protein [Anaerolineales bacterium]